MTNAPMNQTLAAALCELVGFVLTAVEFVEDYVQLRFNRACLTAYTLPVITRGEESLNLTQPGYRDSLSQQIGFRVVRTDVDDHHLSVVFESGATVSISLQEADYTGPEAVQLSLDEKRIWVV